MGILGDIIILAMEAAEIAPHRRNGVGPAARQKMKEGFFLDGIDAFRHQPSVDQAVQSAVPVFPDAADAAFSRLDAAMMAAERAVDLVFVTGAVKKCFLHAAALKICPQPVGRMDVETTGIDPAPPITGNIFLYHTGGLPSREPRRHLVNLVKYAEK
jgi:hypothetical protein